MAACRVFLILFHAFFSINSKPIFIQQPTTTLLPSQRRKQSKIQLCFPHLPSILVSEIMAAGIGFVFCLFAVVFLQHAAAQTEHVVGDSTGWGVPSSQPFYSNWAATRTFRVNDSLRFNFVANAHDVLEVSKDSFDGCNFDNTDNDIIRSSPAIVQLNETGMHYFICTFGQRGHCLGGQKLSINVVSATASGPMSPSSPQPPPSSTPPPSPSSSNAVMTSLYVTLSAIVIVMSLF